MPVISLAEWDRFLDDNPHAHILQTRAWGELKNGFGWQAHAICSKKAGALVLFRRLPLGMTLAYLPKGPVGSEWQELWPDVETLCHQKRAFMLKVELDAWEGDLSVNEKIPDTWVPAPTTVQPRRTITINLEGSESDILGRMKQKTRYNIHLAEHKEVNVRSTQDLATFSQLMRVTSERDGFAVHSQEYYQKAYDLFSARQECVLLMAEYQQRPLAGLLAFRRGRRAWYFYGASSDEERSRMPTYLLQWEAMCWAKSCGCEVYDLWGVPDEDEAVLEAGFENRSDGLWGVYRFKRGFGGTLRRSITGYDVVYQPLFYRFYLWWSKRRKVEG